MPNTSTKREIATDKDLTLTLLYPSPSRVSNQTAVARPPQGEEGRPREGARVKLIETEERSLHKINSQLKAEHVFLGGCIAPNVDSEFGCVIHQ